MADRRIPLVACLALVFAAELPSAAATLDEVIEKHVEAHGGRDAWAAIRTMKIRGSFTAFSKVSPFELTRKRETKYHLDHVLDDKPVVIGHDSETAWWDNHWLQAGAQKIAGPDLGVVLRDAEFETPLFRHEDQGHRLKLIGETELEGIPAIGVEVTREDDSVETWYLDPQSCLAVGRDSPGSDFGQPMPQRTFFDDYREVGGVMIPHLTETQWYTRDRVMRIEDIQINVEVDDSLFQMPAPPGMGPLRSLAGTWSVATQQRPQPGAPWQSSENVSTIEPLLDGALLEERFTTSEGSRIIRTLSFDRFRERYVLTQIDDRTTHMDIQEGTLDEAGRLVVTNTETGTTFETMGFKIHSRVSIFDIADDGFQMEYEVSTDGGENWFVAAKATYDRTDQ